MLVGEDVDVIMVHFLVLASCVFKVRGFLFWLLCYGVSLRSFAALRMTRQRRYVSR
jgi:hypothetical protein